MLSLRIISRLLDYPNQELWEHLSEIFENVDECTELTEENKTKLKFWIAQNKQTRLFDAQAEYCGLFDRGRALSLLLFEHVHGQSRDRGQAMVDLMQQYQQAGLELNAKELPDHLPLYLEYLATLSQEQVEQGLNDIAPILALLAERLSQRESHYSLLMMILLSLTTVTLNQKPLSEKVSKETRDDTPQALDQVWDEEQVTFMDNAACDSNTQQHQRRFANTIQPQYLDINSLMGEE